VLADPARDLRGTLHSFMTDIRRRLTSIALLLLLFEAAGFAMAPIASCCPTTTPSAADADDCCKGVAPGQMCPLHHHRTPSSGSSQQHENGGGATLRGGCATTDPALISLAFGLGIVPVAVSFDVIPVSSPVLGRADCALDVPIAIDAPPPRR